MGENNFNVFLMLIIITIIVSLGILFSSKNLSTTNTTAPDINPGKETNVIENNNANNNENTSNLTTNETKELEKIITNELYLLKTKTSLNDLTNQLKIAIALNKLKATTSQPKNENDELISFTANELEAAYNNSSLSKYGFKHENIKGANSILENTYPEYSYNYSNNIYTYTSKINSPYSDFPEIGHKIITSTKENQNYIISVKYMWGNLTDCGALCAAKVYGKIYNTYDNYLSNETNNIGTLENIKSQTDLTSYFTNNYETLKDKLSTYTYVFEKINEQYKLINFYVN